MAAYKVIQWGTGGVGVWALRQVLDAPDLELVGLKCATDAKAGVDAGIIAGRDPEGIAATKNADELVALDADVVLFMPRVSLKDPTIPGSPGAAWVDEVTPILASGKNVVSSIATGIHYRQLADGDSLVSDSPATPWRHRGPVRPRGLSRFRGRTGRRCAGRKCGRVPRARWT